MSIPNRIRDMEKLLEREKEPTKREHYLNVLRQLQTQLEQL